jgi:hypothetical protein
MNRFVLVPLATAIMSAGVLACHDDAVSPKTVNTPQGPMRDLGTVMVTVDVKNHKITTQPVNGSMASLPRGVSARYYGLVSEIQYLIHEQPSLNQGGGVMEYNLHTGVSNLLDFAIGTNSPFTYPSYPQDTMGIYVYYAIAPFDIRKLAPNGIDSIACPECTVTIDSADGAYPFRSADPTAIPYVYFKSVLTGGGTNAGQPGPFETDQAGLGAGKFNYDRPMSFHTTGGVVYFSFGISAAAAWVEPNESRWHVFYLADSLPNRVSFSDLRSEPDWRVLGTGGTATITPSTCTPNTGACGLQIQIPQFAAGTLVYYRSDSLRQAQDGYISAIMKATPPSLFNTPSIFLGLKDPVKLVQLGISNTSTGFTDSTGAFVGTTVTTDANRRDWRVAKFGTDSAVIYSPSTTKLVSITYNSLPAAPGPNPYDRFFFFGSFVNAAHPTTTSLWSSVNYEIGAHQP